MLFADAGSTRFHCWCREARSAREAALAEAVQSNQRDKRRDLGPLQLKRMHC